MVIPRKLPEACRLRGVKSNGDLRDCKDIYRIGNWCKRQLGKYVDMNPCDTKRASDYAKMMAGDARAEQDLDYFLYAILEECCDCIPKNADRTDDVGVYTTLRPNCQTHGYWDVCAVAPDIKAIIKQGQEAPDLSSVPKICPIFSDWRDSGDRDTIDPAADVFLENMLFGVGCNVPTVWDRCWNMEDKQNRI